MGVIEKFITKNGGDIKTTVNKTVEKTAQVEVQVQIPTEIFEKKETVILLEDGRQLLT